MYTLSYFCGVGPPSSKIYSLVESSQGRITLRNSAVGDIAMEQKRGLPQNNTNIHLLLFNSPVQPPSKLGKRESSKSGVSEIAMEQRRGLPQNTTNIHHLVSCSQIFIILYHVHQSSQTCETMVAHMVEGTSLQACSSS